MQSETVREGRGEGQFDNKKKKDRYFMKDRRLKLQLSHWGQGVKIAVSPTAQCCLGLTIKQNKANMETFLCVVHGAKGY